MEEIGGDPAAQQSANHTHDNTTNPPITFPFTISPANQPAINPTTIQVILAERPSDRMFKGTSFMDTLAYNCAQGKS